MKSRLIPKEVSRVKRQASLTSFLVPISDEIKGIYIHDRAHTVIGTTNGRPTQRYTKEASQDEDHTNKIRV